MHDSVNRNHFYQANGVMLGLKALLVACLTALGTLAGCQQKGGVSFGEGSIVLPETWTVASKSASPDGVLIMCEQKTEAAGHVKLMIRTTLKNAGSLDNIAEEARGLHPDFRMLGRTHLAGQPCLAYTYADYTSSVPAGLTGPWVNYTACTFHGGRLCEFTFSYLPAKDRSVEALDKLLETVSFGL